MKVCPAAVVLIRAEDEELKEGKAQLELPAGLSRFSKEKQQLIFMSF